MRVETARFGPLDIDEATIFTFPMGLLGFARQKRFVVVDHRPESPFKWLQCVDDGDLAFIISDPLFFRRDYHIDVRRSELSVIAPGREEDLIVSVIMTVPPNPQDMSANLLAPLIFNMQNRKAMQYVLTDHRYPVKFFVMRDAQPTAPEVPDRRAAVARSISLR
jgi:flagellar assembly factor FliW